MFRQGRELSSPLYKRYNRNVYCAQKQNIFQTVRQECVLRTETKRFPDDTS